MDIEEIKRQRELGWPDFHPEDYCHICGSPNISWVADLEDWLTATSKWASETGREGICCPSCFLKMYEEASNKKTILVIAPWRGSWDKHGS